jgi:membrane protein DedA with SNARE-associated domain
LLLLTEPAQPAAGALHYPRKHFLTALALGRGIRFVLDAYLGHVYGAEILGFFRAYYQPVLYVLIGLAVAGGLGALFYFAYWRKKHSPKQKPGESSKGNQQVA